MTWWQAGRIAFLGPAQFMVVNSIRNTGAGAATRLRRSIALTAALIAAPAIFAQTEPFVGPSFLPNPFWVQSTIPTNGDLNPACAAMPPREAFW